jgi:hypothetical protein
MTATAALLPLAAATAQYLVREVGGVVKQGVSFVEMLQAPDATATTAATTEVGSRAGESLELTSDSQLVRWKTAWQNMDAQTAALHQILVDKLQASGVDLSDAIELRTDADGRILVAPGHPDRGAIEQVLDADPELTSQLRTLFHQVANLKNSSGADAAPNAADIRLVVNKDHAFFASE